MMSSPVCRGFSAPVTYVLPVGNPITMQDVIDAPNKKAIAVPVAKKSAPISFMLTRGVSKLLDVVRTVIVTFLETLVTKPIAPKTIRENWRPVHSTPFALVDVDVPLVFKQEVGDQASQRHQCDYLDCPSCHEYVDAQTHRCFIQRALSPQELREQKKKRKRRGGGGPCAKRGAAAGLQTLQANEAEDE